MNQVVALLTTLAATAVGKRLPRAGEPLQYLTTHGKIVAARVSPLQNAEQTVVGFRFSRGFHACLSLAGPEKVCQVCLSHILKSAATPPLFSSCTRQTGPGKTFTRITCDFNGVVGALF